MKPRRFLGYDMRFADVLIFGVFSIFVLCPREVSIEVCLNFTPIASQRFWDFSAWVFKNCSLIFSIVSSCRLNFLAQFWKYLLELIFFFKILFDVHLSKRVFSLPRDFHWRNFTSSSFFSSPRHISNFYWSMVVRNTTVLKFSPLCYK